mgnify:CR=1 FL=1
MDEALIKRVPPHSIEAEQSVVGAILMDRDAITVAAEIICGDDFYQKAYGVIFDSVVELFNEGKPVDLITLQNRLREKAVPEEISSLEFVRDLVTAVPTSANVKYYAEIVSEKATLRRLIKMNEARSADGSKRAGSVGRMSRSRIPTCGSVFWKRKSRTR